MPGHNGLALNRASYPVVGCREASFSQGVGVTGRLGALKRYEVVAEDVGVARFEGSCAVRRRW